MVFKDQWVETADGERFIFTVEMQRALFEAGLEVEPEALSRLPRRVRDELDMPTATTSPASAPAQDGGGASADGIRVDAQTGKFLGRLKVYRRDRGFGFIERGNGETIFFHRSQTLEDPTSFEQDAWLLYETRETAKGMEAYDVEGYAGDIPA